MSRSVRCQSSLSLYRALRLCLVNFHYPYRESCAVCGELLPEWPVPLTKILFEGKHQLFVPHRSLSSLEISSIATSPSRPSLHQHHPHHHVLLPNHSHLYAWPDVKVCYFIKVIYFLRCTCTHIIILFLKSPTLSSSFSTIVLSIISAALTSHQENNQASHTPP